MSPSSHYFSPSAPLEQTSRHVEATLSGLTLRFTTGDGVFSKSAFDEGSRLLLETALKRSSWPLNARVGDLGCGWGSLGCFIAALAPQVWVFGCDINERAVALAHQNARTHQLTNASFWCGDGLDAARSDFFDVIFCNPPVRAGNETIGRLFEGAHRCLKPGGELWVVLRTAQGAKSWQKRLQAQFGRGETIEIKSGYRILKCRKQTAGGRRQDEGS
jgi:16S rRNA (guanine1207-N2)-methyltransferase